MLRAFSYDNLLKGVSGAIFCAIATLVVVETNLLPPIIRIPARDAIHRAGDQAVRLPIVSKMLRSVGS